MRFNLYITIGGLCLFVEDHVRRDGKKLLHVLMPQTGHGPHAEHPEHTNIELHQARLLYPQHHTLPGLPFTTTPETLDLGNAGLDLSLLKDQPGWTPDLSRDGLLEIGALVNRRVDRPLLDDANTNGLVVSRITIGAGAVNQRVRGARWKVAGQQPMHLATSLEWVIPDLEGDSLHLNFNGLNGSVAPSPVVLYPHEKPAGNEIRLWIYYSPRIPQTVPPSGSPTPLDKGDMAHHISAFFALLGLIPAYEDWPDDPGGGGGGGGPIHRLAMHTGSHVHAPAAPAAHTYARVLAAPAAAAFFGEELSCVGGRALAAPQT